jgi:hypothetical protein
LNVPPRISQVEFVEGLAIAGSQDWPSGLVDRGHGQQPPTYTLIRANHLVCAARSGGRGLAPRPQVLKRPIQARTARLRARPHGHGGWSQPR